MKKNTKRELDLQKAVDSLLGSEYDYHKALHLAINIVNAISVKCDPGEDDRLLYEVGRWFVQPDFYDGGF